MFKFLKKNIKIFIIWFLLILWFCCYFPINQVHAVAPKYEKDFSKWLTEGHWVNNPNVDANETVRWNIKQLFYPQVSNSGNAIYRVIKDITLWIMIIFIIMAWASLLMDSKPENTKKNLKGLMYILLWWLFIYAANWLFWSVFTFSGDVFTDDISGWWVERFTDSLIWKVFFFVLSALKVFAFFLAIIMTVVTWFRVIAAWEWEKWKKLVKWLINIVVALLIIKWVDFIYSIAADDEFVSKASDFIINIAKLFGYLYGVIIVIMVIVSWYLYMTDWWSGSNFKKASTILINILLSALILFAFLLILYQVFAEFQTWWDAVTEPTAYISMIKNIV